MGKPIRQRPGETACPATPFLTASDPSAGLLNRLADLRQAVPECLLLHVGCRSRPPPALRTVNIPSPRLPHPATSQIYRGQGLALPSPCLSSLVRPARYIPSVDSGLETRLRRRRRPTPADAGLQPQTDVQPLVEQRRPVRRRRLPVGLGRLGDRTLQSGLISHVRISRILTVEVAHGTFVQRYQAPIGRQ